MNGIPAKSVDITCLACQQLGGQTGLKLDNNFKTTYKVSAAIMVDCVSWATK